MASTTMEDILSQHTFFKGLDPKLLEFVAQYATQTTFESGEYLLREGHPADDFYLIQKGQVNLGTFIPGHGFTTIQTLEKDEMVGWSWLIPPHEWRFSALVTVSTEVIVFDGKRLRDECEKDPNLGYELLKRLALVVGQRLTATRMRLEF